MQTLKVKDYRSDMFPSSFIVPINFMQFTIKKQKVHTPLYVFATIDQKLVGKRQDVIAIDASGSLARLHVYDSQFCVPGQFYVG